MIRALYYEFHLLLEYILKFYLSGVNLSLNLIKFTVRLTSAEVKFEVII